MVLLGSVLLILFLDLLATSEVGYAEDISSILWFFGSIYALIGISTIVASWKFELVGGILLMVEGLFVLTITPVPFFALPFLFAGFFFLLSRWEGKQLRRLAKN